VLGQEGLSMRKARELLRLCLDTGHSGRQAARSVGISASTASVYLRRTREAHLDWATVEEMLLIGRNEREERMR
jgi:transposase